MKKTAEAENDETGFSDEEINELLKRVVALKKTKNAYMLISKTQ